MHEGVRSVQLRSALAAIDIFLFTDTEGRKLYNILRQNARREKYCVWSYLTSQNFGKLKTDNTIFYAAISPVKNICIERKIFCIVTRRPYLYPPASTPFVFRHEAISRESRFFVWNIQRGICFGGFSTGNKFVCIKCDYLRDGDRAAEVDEPRQALPALRSPSS